MKGPEVTSSCAKCSTFGLYLKNDQNEISDRLVYDMQGFGANNFSVLPGGVWIRKIHHVMGTQMRNPGGTEA